ncbi:uncharacterized protein EMH_0010080 [Eimeria mitis]|uniref:Nuclear migration protein nudC n=1 Tax=Eimeria mitis TaxID=44415 RepID=U6K426_9EIME|nr:uncharacterized protein EMH_0010080 [Eimeria mitis]CDJ31736.1 hypothetical protein EMH_0010080 [Eimeria mitis]
MGSAAGDSTEDNRFDGLFATVAEQAGGIEPLFDYFFGFLCRKTDFFTVGRAACKDMLDKSFRKWTDKATEKAEKERIQREKQQKQQQQRQQQRQEQERQRQRQQPVDLSNRPKVEELTEEEEALFAPAENKAAAASTAAADVPPSAKSTGEEGDTSDDEKETTRPEGNGGQTDKLRSRPPCEVVFASRSAESRYRWTQTLESVDVYVPVGEGVRAAQCEVKITATRLTLGLKGQAPILSAKTTPR